ncbi:hypothetical protein LINPERHAP2_LOCUS23346 [Linum perenne]
MRRRHGFSPRPPRLRFARSLNRSVNPNSFTSLKSQSLCLSDSVLRRFIRLLSTASPINTLESRRLLRFSPRCLLLLLRFPYAAECKTDLLDSRTGTLDLFQVLSFCTPVKVSYFDSNVEQMACGMRHSLVLLKGGVGNQVYVFGSGKRGQLCISVKSASLPRVTSGFEDVEVAGVSSNGDYSVALSVAPQKLNMVDGMRTIALKMEFGASHNQIFERDYSNYRGMIPIACLNGGNGGGGGDLGRYSVFATSSERTIERFRRRSSC